MLTEAYSAGVITSPFAPKEAVIVPSPANVGLLKVLSVPTPPIASNFTEIDPARGIPEPLIVT